MLRLLIGFFVFDLLQSAICFPHSFHSASIGQSLHADFQIWLFLLCHLLLLE
jgi:hypothetical protein